MTATAKTKSLFPLVDKFLSAMKIPHGGRRAAVCTGIAHDMTMGEINIVTARILDANEARLAKFRELNAPQCMIDMLIKEQDAIKSGKQPIIRLLTRVYASKAVAV